MWIALHWPPPAEPAAPALPAAPHAADAALAAGGTDAQGASAPRLLAAVALGYTPHVAWAADGDALLLDVHACLRLWGGAARLLEQLAAAAAQVLVDPARMRLALAAAPTARGALALARCLPRAAADDTAGMAPPLAADTATLAARLDRLPLAALGPAALGGHAPTLARLGCRTLGDLRRLPRGGLARRYGSALLDALDAAYGLRREAHAWITPPERFDETVELPFRVESADALAFAGQRLLQAAHGWLAARHAGARRLRFDWRCEPRRRAAAGTADAPPDTPADAQAADGGTLALQASQPVRDLAHWQRLLREQLARYTLPAPALSLRLSIDDAEPLLPRNGSLLPNPHDFQDQALRFLEHAQARFGAGAVRRAALADDHRPARRTLWQPAGVGSRAAAPVDAAAGAAALPRPPWLLEPPLALACDDDARPMYQGRLRLLAGPERIDCGWWEAAAPAGTDAAPGPAAADAAVLLRDYYLAESPHAGLLWVFLQRGGDAAGGWFLHGLYG
jgi:protein ImuB